MSDSYSVALFFVQILRRIFLTLAEFLFTQNDLKGVT
nr:MAG TPA: hypothetical protein [Caudoviricetes sp.]